MDRDWNLPEWAAWQGWLVGIALATARLAPTFVLTPLIGGQAVPARIRFAAAVTLATMMSLAVNRPTAAADGPGFVVLLLAESLFGIVAAFVLLLLFEACASFGALVDQARGEGALAAQDPFVQFQQTTLASFARQIAAMAILTLGGHRVVLRAFADSLISFPAGSLAALIPALRDRPAEMIRLSGEMLDAAVQLALPIFGILFITDVCLGLCNRVAQRIEVYLLSLPLKALLTLGLLALLGPLLIGSIDVLHASWLLRLCEFLGYSAAESG